MGRFRGLKTFYNGMEFRSKVEARWAVVFDAMGFDWHYETQGVTLGDGTKYCPDFSLWDVKIENEWRNKPEFIMKDVLYVEIKGAPYMDKRDLDKIMKFSERHAILILNEVPRNLEYVLKYWNKRTCFPVSGSEKTNRFCFSDNVYCDALLNFFEENDLDWENQHFGKGEAESWERLKKEFPYKKDMEYFEELNPCEKWYSIIKNKENTHPMYPQIRECEPLIATPEVVGYETETRWIDGYSYEDEFPELGIGKETQAAFSCGNSAKFDHGLTPNYHDVKKMYSRFLERK